MGNSTLCAGEGAAVLARVSVPVRTQKLRALCGDDVIGYSCPCVAHRNLSRCFWSVPVWNSSLSMREQGFLRVNRCTREKRACILQAAKSRAGFPCFMRLYNTQGVKRKQPGSGKTWQNPFVYLEAFAQTHTRTHT